MLLAPRLGLIYLYNDSIAQVAENKDNTSTTIQPRQTQRQHKYKDTAQTNTKTAHIQGYGLDKYKDSTSSRIQPTQRRYKYNVTA